MNKKIQWVDLSDRSKSGQIFSIRCGKLGIIVTNTHIYFRPKWVVHCFALGIDSQIMENINSVDEAKARAIEIVGARIDEIRDAFIKIKRTVKNG